MKYTLAIIISIIVTIVDQITKYWAVDLKNNKDQILIKNFLDFSYAENKGAAFSIMAGWDENIRYVIFTMIIIVFMVMVFYFLKQISDRQKALIASIGMLLGGGFGNSIDRLSEGYVIDFISAHYYKLYYWPTFNVADIAMFSIGLKSPNIIPMGYFSCLQYNAFAKKFSFLDAMLVAMV